MIVNKLRVGLIGAGPWAGMVHAPAIAAHPGTELVSVWARKPEQATALAGPLGAGVAADPDELIAGVDAVAFAVPPTVQAELAIRAAKAGKHLILEKPTAGDLLTAQQLADTVTEARVASLVMLTKRFDPAVKAWLAEAEQLGGWLTADARWLNDAALDGPFANSPWRKERGALLDVGPHVIDLLDAALGRVEDIPAVHRAEPDLWHIVLTHASGATSSLALSLQFPMRPGVSTLTLYGPNGQLPLVDSPTSAVDCFRGLLDDLLLMIEQRNWTHPCDARRGYQLQLVIETIEHAVARA